MLRTGYIMYWRQRVPEFSDYRIPVILAIVDELFIVVAFSKHLPVWDWCSPYISKRICML